MQPESSVRYIFLSMYLSCTLIYRKSRPFTQHQLGARTYISWSFQHLPPTNSSRQGCQPLPSPSITKNRSVQCIKIQQVYVQISSTLSLHCTLLSLMEEGNTRFRSTSTLDNLASESLHSTKQVVVPMPGCCYQLLKLWRSNITIRSYQLAIYRGKFNYVTLRVCIANNVSNETNFSFKKIFYRFLLTSVEPIQLFE